jgi:glutamine amidotransferase
LKSPDQVEDINYRLPHIGWNQLKIGVQAWKDTLLSQTQENELVYFVHSYYPIVQNKDDIVALAHYGGQKFCVAVQHKNVCGTQFHPEKSGKTGLRILESFCNKNGV